MVTVSIVICGLPDFARGMKERGVHREWLWPQTTFVNLLICAKFRIFLSVEWVLVSREILQINFRMQRILSSVFLGIETHK